MSVKALAWAMEQRVGDARRKVILLALADFADNRGECFPSQATLADIAECSVDTVQRCLKKLEADAFIARRRRHTTNGNRTSDRYELLFNNDGLSRTAVRSSDEPKPQNAALTTPQSYAETKPRSYAGVTFTEPDSTLGICASARGGNTVQAGLRSESPSDRAHREAFEKGQALKAGAVAKSARSEIRTKGELDGSRGVSFAAGRLVVGGGAASELAGEFPGVDLTAACNRAAPEVGRLNWPTRDDAMAVIRKWAQIITDDAARGAARRGGKPPKRTLSDVLAERRAAAGGAA